MASAAISTTMAEALAELAATARRSLVEVRSGQAGLGAGVVWQPDGIVVTNYHVVARGEPQVRMSDGRSYAAQLAAFDPDADLAVLTVEARGLAAATIGNAQALRVGQLVLAIGHPWGQQGVLTAGIVSSVEALPRRTRPEPLAVIRSDVALAPGNSGGPLLDAAGAVVGINTMVLGGDLSISIPSYVVEEFVQVALARQVLLGVGVRPAPLPEFALAQVGRLQRSGLLVVELLAGGPAAGAGIQPGDLLVDLSGAALESPGSLLRALAARQPGERVQLSLLRANQWRQAAVDLARLEH